MSIRYFEKLKPKTLKHQARPTKHCSCLIYTLNNEKLISIVTLFASFLIHYKKYKKKELNKRIVKIIYHYCNSQ